MKTILIPPIPNLPDFCETTGAHLLLSHLFTSPEYVSFYQRRRQADDFLILDNDAHEHKKGQDIEALLGYRDRVDAQEIVLPDSLFNSSETALRSMDAMGKIRRRYGEKPPFSMMVVPQGQSLAMWSWCLKTMVTTFCKTFPTGILTIGMSKDYEVWSGGILNLLTTYVEPTLKRHPRLLFDIHLLGWGRQLNKLREIVRDSPLPIRSTDSAKPFVYALNMIKLDPSLETVPPYPKRPGQYFQLKMNKEEMGIAYHNVAVFRDQVAISEPTGD
jgi:hypothetical protein